MNGNIQIYDIYFNLASHPDHSQNLMESNLHYGPSSYFFVKSNLYYLRNPNEQKEKKKRKKEAKRQKINEWKNLIPPLWR